LVCATNRDIQRMALLPRGTQGSFMFDLYQRLAALVIRLPALREHREDIPAIANRFWFTATGGQALTAAQTAALMDYSYPGNVRELLNILKLALALKETDFSKVMAEYRETHKTLIDGMEAQFARATPDSAQTSEEALPLRKDAMLHRWAQSVFDRCNHNLTASAQAAGCSLNAFKGYLHKSGR